MTQVADMLRPPVSETRDGAGSSVSSREERGNAGARARAGPAAARPRRTQSKRPSAGEGDGAGAGRRERLLGYTGRKQRRRVSYALFLFFFSKANFKLDFESSFEFESTTQYKKIQCNSMNAHSCNYTL
jgi:hypothetical protein